MWILASGLARLTFIDAAEQTVFPTTIQIRLWFLWVHRNAIIHWSQYTTSCSKPPDNEMALARYCQMTKHQAKKKKHDFCLQVSHCWLSWKLIITLRVIQVLIEFSESPLGTWGKKELVLPRKRARCFQNWNFLEHLQTSKTTRSLYFFWPHHTACKIFVPWPGIEPGTLAVKVPGPNPWTARELSWVEQLGCDM